MRVTDRKGHQSHQAENVFGEAQSAILERKADLSWRALGRSVGIHHATLYFIALGPNGWHHVSWDALRGVLRALGLPDPGRRVVGPYLRKPAVYRDLFDIPKKVLTWKLAHRERIE